ncbi:hypothetical protein CBR_g49101 [Chara braunii]|uniref:Integrase catalytic domain-containing protein n=1 Tax=Chara braunii TaxID=69332 RepID=A0A388K4R2_CHABU|nr:hypothetical protein CBR_g49101 [Chara braunii]|eukprot:GBG65031.1 hypothetical protein CBR_g49101 [Chara braunii]
MEVNAWTAGANGPTEMCGVIPEINGDRETICTPILRLGKEMATEEGINDQQSGGNQGTNGDGERNEGSARDRESAKLEGTRENGKDASIGESSGKAGGSKRGPQENTEGGNDMRTSPRNSAGATPKKTKVSDASRKLAEIEKQTAEFKARLIEQMMAEHEEDPRAQGHVRDVGPVRTRPEVELAAVQRKNYATYNDFLRAFTLVALRIPGVTDRIMSKYFLKQFSEFDKDKILSAYQQTSKFEYTRDVDFSTVTDLAEKTVVTETLALLKEGEVIDLTGKTGDKVKKGIESLHERVHGVDSKMDKMENALLVMQAQVSRPALPPQEAVVPVAVANRGFGRRDPATEQCKYCTMIGHFVRVCPRLNHDIERQRCSRSLKGEILEPRGERVNWNSPGGMRRAVILLINLKIVVIEAEPIAEIVWDQPRERGPLANFILEGNGHDRVNITTRRADAENKFIQDTVIKELAGTSTGQQETEAGEQEKVYGKPREDEPVDKASAAKKKFRYQIPILTSLEIDGTLSKLLGTMVSVSFQTMLQASPRLLKGLKQLLTRKRVEVEEAPKLQEQDTEEAETPQGVSNLQSIPGGLGNLEKAFADIRLSLPDREGGEVMRAPPGTKLSFHALSVGKLKVQIGTHHTDALVDGGAEITLIRRDFATVTECTVNKEVAGSIRGAGGEIPFTGYVTKCAIRAGIRKSIWSFQRMTVMEEMDHEVILGRPWCANVEMIGMHLHDGTYMVDIEDPVTGRGELLRLLGTGGDPPKGKLATWSPTFEESARKEAFARMEGMRERVEIMIEEAFSKKEWIKMGLPHECWNDKGPAYEFGIAAEVTDLLRAKIDSFVAEPTASPYANKWFVFTKPNKTLKWIQDLQKLNAVTIRDAGSLPQTDLLAESHAGRSICSLVDLYSGYDQLPLDARDRPCTAMHNPVGQLQMQVTPMGFTNAVAEAQRRMLAVAGDMFPEKYILDARDNLNGYVEAVTLKKKTGKAVADWVEDFYLRHPFVRRFIADNGTKFVNQEVSNRLKTLCVLIKITEPYHPEANAPVERRYRTFKNTIAKLAADNLGSWPRFLKQAVFAKNMTPKRITVCIPAELWYGREIDFLIEALVPTRNRLDDDPHLSTEELITARCQQVARNEETLEEVVNRVTDSRMRDKARWDQVKNIRKESLQVGEKVLVRNSALESTWSGQLGKRFKGPYRIAKRVGLNTVELEDLDGTSIRGSFPGQRLVRFFSRDLVEQWLQEAQDRETGELTA